MSIVYNGVIVEDRWDRLNNQMSLFKDDGKDPNGKFNTPGDWTKSGKWNRSPEGWTFFDVLEHGEYFKDLEYFYLSEVGGEGNNRYTVYRRV